MVRMKGEPVYEPGEVALVDAIIREFGEGVFKRAMHENQNARPFVAEDGSWRLRLGDPEFTFWLDDDDVLCFGVQLGVVLHTGRSINGEREFDDPALLDQFNPN
jgi:hypothetical protein